MAHDSKAFFDALQVTYGQKHNCNCPVKYTKGVILTKTVEKIPDGGIILKRF